jgi:murein endopeptidase
MWALLVVSLGGADASADAADAADVAERTPLASFPSAVTEHWIRHPRLARESLGSIATRFGVSDKDLLEWNPGVREVAAKDEVLRVRVAADAPAQVPVYVHVGKDATWNDLAARYGTTVDALQSDNPQHARRKTPPKGARLTVWVKSGVQRLPGAAPVQPLPAFEVPPGGVAVGPPHRGRLEGGVKLPDSDLYTIRFEKLCYGTSLAVADLQSVLAGFRRETGYEHELFIGAMSRKTGRKLRPHKSHRTGRDVDIRLPALPHAVGYKLERDEIDWPAAWALVDTFARTGDIHMIFLERKLWPRLRRAAMRTGATDEQLERAFGLIRHSKGHTAHIHVRFVCSADATECED